MAQNFEAFGKYVLLEKLATGGMAEVYLSKAPGAIGIAKFVAIKRILPQFSDNPEFIDMFKDEAKIAINLSHSNIVSIYEFGVEKKQFFLVMDYVEGRNLRQLLNKIKKGQMNLSIDQIVYVIKEVAAGLDHAHRCLDGTTGRPLNITHRDMSPQNIMVSYEGEVKIVDFGIAKAESQIESTRAGTLKGKFGYMSPEQADGLPVDLRTDIFSLGIILWELLANDRLFIANNEINTLRKIRECQVPSLRKINPNIPAELERITNKSLARDRNLRYQTAAAFHRDLNRFLNRQYPDFSPQDFSVFIKTLFANEILENRKRLIEYSKVQLQKSPTADDDEVTQTLTSTTTSTTTETETDSKDVNFYGQRPGSGSAKPADPNHPGMPIIDLDEGNFEIENENVIKFKHGVKKENKIELEETSNRSKTNFTPGPIRSGRGKLKVKKGINVIKILPVLMLLVVLTGGSGAFYCLNAPATPSPFLVNMCKQVGLGGKIKMSECDESNPECTDEYTPPTPNRDTNDPLKYRLMVLSDPHDAEIYLNGEPYKDSSGKTARTPHAIRIAPDVQFDLTLKAKGHNTYSKKLITRKNGSRYVAKLVKAEIGYLDIDVFPSGGTLFINGQRIKDVLPLRQYSVPANTRLVIRAENYLTRTVDQKVIVVKKDSRKKITLVTDKPADTLYRDTGNSNPRVPSGGT